MEHQQESVPSRWALGDYLCSYTHSVHLAVITFDELKEVRSIQLTLTFADELVQSAIDLSPPLGMPVKEGLELSTCDPLRIVG